MSNEKRFILDISIAPIAAVVLVLAVLAFSAFYTIETGYVGVISTLGKYDPEEKQPGAHFKIPLLQKVIKFDIKLHTVNYDARRHQPQEGLIDKPELTVLDDKNLPIRMDVSVQFHPIPDQADQILAKYGRNYFEKKMNPIIRNAVRDVVGHYQAETIALERNKLGQELKARIQRDFEGTEFIIDDVVIRDIRLPKVILEKVEEVQKAKQEEQRLAMVEKQAKKKQEIERINAETRLIQITTKAKADAERRRIAAEAEAYAIKTKAKAQAEANRIISQSITPELIRYRQIDRWNGVMPQTLVGGEASGVLLNMQSK